MTAISVMSAW